MVVGCLLLIWLVPFLVFRKRICWQRYRWIVEALQVPEALSPKIAAIAAGSFQKKQPLEIRGTGYVVDSLEASLWAFAGSESFEEGALKAANLGDDADTTGAVFGQIGGAFYGVEGVPEGWLEKVAMRGKIEELVVGLMQVEGRPA